MNYKKHLLNVAPIVDRECLKYKHANHISEIYI